MTKDYCDNCKEEVPLGQQHFLRLTSPFSTISFLLCFGCFDTLIEALGESVERMTKR